MKINIHGGYQYFMRKGDIIYVHRHVMEKKLGRKLNSNEIVHHIDGNKLNNKPENLEVKTFSEHSKQHFPDGPPIKWIHGTQNFGSKNGRAKLNEKDIPVIRKRLSQDSMSAIARDYNVDPTTIRAIRDKQSWNHIK